MAQKLQWFPFYADDFWNDEAVLAMGFAEVGLYLKLLSHQWREGSIPEDEEKIARITHCDRDELARLWPGVRPCFASLPGDENRLINERLNAIEGEQKLRHKKLSDAGIKGNEAKKKVRTPGGRQADAIEQSRVDQSKTKDPLRSPLDGVEKPGASKPKYKGKKTQGTPTPAPADFKPTPASLEWLRGKYGKILELEIEHETEQFILHSLKGGKIFVDWQAAWKTWMNNWRTNFSRNVPSGPTAEGPYPWEANGDPNLIRDEEDDHQQQPPVP